MDLGRYLVEAHLVEGRSVAELARAHGVHRSWIYKLLARYAAEGEAGLVPRSRRPKTSPTEIYDLYEDEIVAIRKELSDEASTPGRRRSTTTSQSATRWSRRSLPSGGCCGPRLRRRPAP